MGASHFRNGRPVSAEELAEQDRERAQEARDGGAPVQRARQGARATRWEVPHDRGEAVGDIYNVFDIRMIKRERIEGHDTIAFTLTPRPDSAPKTREGELMKHFNVRAWISETDHELVRLEAEAIDNVAFGLGVLARLHKGASLSFLRRKINGEVWLPAMSNYSGSARVGLLWTLRRTGTIEYPATRSSPSTPRPASTARSRTAG